MAAVAAGANRQEMYEVIREHSLGAWTEVASGRPNSLVARLAEDERISRFVPADGIRGLLNAGGYVGDAPERARRMAATMRKAVG